MVSCCPAILFFLFFFILSKQKKGRERSKSNFWKGMTKTNVCCNVVPKTQPSSSSIKQAQGVFLQVDAAVLHLHNHSSCMPVVFSSKPSRITLPQLLRPQYAMKLGGCQGCFLQSDEQKKSTNAWIMNYKKHMQHGHKDVFPVTLSFIQKSDLQTGHLREDRSEVCVKLRVIKKTTLCRCGVF